MSIFNLTGKQITDEQHKQGVYDPEDRTTAVAVSVMERIRGALRFYNCPDRSHLLDSANLLVSIVDEYKKDGTDTVLIDGPSYFIPVLEHALLAAGYRVVYPFFESVPVKKTVNGSTRRVYVLKQTGLVEGGVLDKQ